MKNENDLKKKAAEKLTQLYNWPEDKVKSLLKQKLEASGWAIIEIHWGKEQGKDLVVAKNQRSIVFEAKGEPKSLISEYTERRHFVRDALSSLISYMVTDDADCRYCIAFPANKLYIRHVLKQIPIVARRKLGLYAIFLNEHGSTKVLLPDEEELQELTLFDDLFERG